MKYRTDPSLLSEVRKYGRFDTNACLQCGSCTVSCDLTNNTDSFPRKTLRYTLIGLREQLKSRLEPWLCYYCGDCSTTCPRQTEPGEAMMTLRRYLTAQYDWTGLSAKIYKSKFWEIGSLLFFGIIVLLLVVYYHLFYAELEYEVFISEPMPMEHMFGLIGTFTTVVFLIPLFFLLINSLRMYWLTMRSGDNLKIPFHLYYTEAKTFLLHAITQKRFRDCAVRNRWIKHLILAAGCGLMVFIKFFFLEWFQTDSIYPVYHPQRWLGYFAAGALIYTTVEILISRIKKREEIHKFSNANDLIFPIMLLLTAVSGLAVHIFRYLGLELTTHFTYAIHLAIAVPMLIIEIPFGKWSHMIYRPLAIYFKAVKEKALQVEINKEPVLENV
ncbi:MAG: 4Fe-4S dicluster domain-containing protein [Bacteroidetes bacterium]|nr:4Fe-4S dicluster domain-containing protein [Bacteroidota bacterium]MBU2506909.1 4Fe-4S dicluster domain-containing protein [Bacteroidota bacterium]